MQSRYAGGAASSNSVRGAAGSSQNQNSRRKQQEEGGEADVDFDDRRERARYEVPQTSQIPSSGVGYKTRQNNQESAKRNN